MEGAVVFEAEAEVCAGGAEGDVVGDDVGGIVAGGRALGEGFDGGDVDHCSGWHREKLW